MKLLSDMGGSIIMSEQEFLEKLADILNTGMDLTMDMELDDIDSWDSLGALALMGMCFEATGKGVLIEKVRSAVTVRDLYELL